MLDKIRPHLDKLLPALAFAILASSTAVWAMQDQTPPPWDPADHLNAAYDYYHYLARLDFAGFLREFFVEKHFYAPLTHLVTALVFLAFGASRLTGIFVNFIALVVLFGSVVWIARTLYGEASRAGALTAGAVAALLAACYHFPAWLLHDAFLDFPLMAMVTASFALLIRAGDFRVRRDAILFGISAGLGLLTKQTFAFFFILPALYVAVKVLLARDLKAIGNLLLAAVVAVAIAAAWYGPHLQDVLEIYQVNREAAAGENEAPLLSFKSNVFYLHALVSAQIQLPFAVLFLCGLIYSAVRKFRQSIILYLWLVSGLLAFSMVANKDIRYTVPVLPAVAMLSVCWLGEARGRLKMALATPIVIWAFVSFFNAQWPAAGMGTHIDIPEYRFMVFGRNYYRYDHRPLGSDWGIPDVVRTVADHHAESRLLASVKGAAGSGGLPVIGVVVNLPYLNPSGVGLYSRLLSPERAGPPLLKVDYLTTESALVRMEDCEYLLVRTGLDRAEWVAPAERRVEALIGANPAHFQRVAGFPIPLEQAEAVIYRRVE